MEGPYTKSTTATATTESNTQSSVLLFWPSVLGFMKESGPSMPPRCGLNAKDPKGNNTKNKRTEACTNVENYTMSNHH